MQDTEWEQSGSGAMDVMQVLPLGPNVAAVTLSNTVKCIDLPSLLFRTAEFKWEDMQERATR